MDLPTILIGGFFWLCGLAYVFIPLWILADIEGFHFNKKKKSKKQLLFQKKSSIKKVYLIFKFTIRDPKLFFGVFSTRRKAEKFIKTEKDWRMVNCDIRLIDGLYYVLHDEYTYIDKICYSLEEAEANFKTDYEMVDLLECYVDDPSKTCCIKTYDDMENPEVIKRILRWADEIPSDTYNPTSFPKPRHSTIKFRSVNGISFTPPPLLFM